MRRAPLSIAALLSLGGCDMGEAIISTEVRGDGKATAIVKELGGNATVPYTYYVLVSRNADDSDQTTVLKIDRSGSPSIAWQPDGSLLIDAPCGEIYAFQNYALFQQGQEREKVSVVLKNVGVCR